MVDKQVELEFEAKKNLLTNKGYFDRIRHYSITMSLKDAWASVEAELPFNLRRFTNYDSFIKARSCEAKKKLKNPHFVLDELETI